VPIPWPAGRENTAGPASAKVLCYSYSTGDLGSAFMVRLRMGRGFGVDPVNFVERGYPPTLKVRSRHV